jgi:prevent-host-death family protein
MQMVGIKELKNKLTYYLGLTRKGDSIVVTDRGVPIAVLHNLDAVEDTASIGEKLAGLAKQGMIRLPLKRGKLTPFKPIKVKGKPAWRSCPQSIPFFSVSLLNELPRSPEGFRVEVATIENACYRLSFRT